MVLHNAVADRTPRYVSTMQLWHNKMSNKYETETNLNYDDVLNERAIYIRRRRNDDEIEIMHSSQ